MNHIVYPLLQNGPTDLNPWQSHHHRLHTGDIGYYDERENLFLVDRLKELIKVISMSAGIKIRNKKWLPI